MAEWSASLVFQRIGGWHRGCDGSRMQDEPIQPLKGEVNQEPPLEMTGHRSQQDIDQERVRSGRLEADDETRDQDEFENPDQI